MSSRNEEKKSFTGITTAGLAGDLPGDLPDVSHLSLSAVAKPAKIGMEAPGSPGPSRPAEPSAPNRQSLLASRASNSNNSPNLQGFDNADVPDQDIDREELDDAFFAASSNEDDYMFRKPPKSITGPPSRKDDSFLPGTDINFNEGWEMFSRQVVFCMDSDRDVHYYDPKTKLANQHFYDPRNKLAKQPAETGKTLTGMLQELNKGSLYGQSINDGSSNAFYNVNPEQTLEIANLTKNEVKIGEYPGEMGIRRRESLDRLPLNSPTKADTDQLGLLWEEVWMTLHAAACGLHPHVYACGLVPDPQGQYNEMIYVVEKHWPLYNFLTGTKKHDDFDHGEGLKDDLQILMKNAADMGLIHGDINPSNLVVDISGRSGRQHNLMFIDLDAQWTRFDTSDANCVETINSFMLLINGHCGHGAHITAVSGLLHGVAQRLQKTLLPPYLGDEEPAAKKKFGKSGQNLCNVFIHERSSWPRLARDPGVNDASFSLFQSNNMAIITETLLGLANHYAVYYEETKTTKRGCFYKPFEGEDAIDPNKPAIEKLVNIIATRILGDELISSFL